MSRLSQWFIFAMLAFALSGCSASAKVTRTTPVADLRPYRVVGVRAAGTLQPGALLNQLEMSTISQLVKRCQFDSVVPAARSSGTPDLVLDLNIQRSFRGGTGMIKNENKVVPVKTSWQRGKQAGVSFNERYTRLDRHIAA